MNKRIPQVTRVAKALGLARAGSGWTAARAPHAPVVRGMPERPVVFVGGRWYWAARTRVCPHR